MDRQVKLLTLLCFTSLLAPAAIAQDMEAEIQSLRSEIDMMRSEQELHQFQNQTQRLLEQQRQTDERLRKLPPDVSCGIEYVAAEYSWWQTFDLSTLSQMRFWNKVCPTNPPRKALAYVKLPSGAFYGPYDLLLVTPAEAEQAARRKYPAEFTK